VDLSGWVGVRLGENCDCRCGILYAPKLGGGFMQDWLVSDIFFLSFSLFFGPFCYWLGGWSASRVLLCVRRFGAFGFMEVVF